MSAKDALLEIGSEELPASFVPIGMRQLKTLAEASLAEHKLSFSVMVVYGTPRRLALLISGLPDRSEDQKRVISGPPAKIAKDSQGQWTPAAIGFAKKQGLHPADLTLEGDKLSAVLHIKGTGTKKLLADLFPRWIGQLEFPKAMIWEPSHFRFPRPIRWLAGLYGADLIPFSVAGVRSGRVTFGLALQSNKKIVLSQAAKYATLLKNQCVIVDPKDRLDSIRRLAEQSVKRVHGHVLLHPALLEQVSNLVEHPVAILGNFDPAYLNLPSEVLITCLEHHQKFFPVTTSATGHKLLPNFVGIRNGISMHQEIVREGYERVLAARLADARFFYSQDRQSPLAARVDSLKGVIFQEKLGTLYDKAQRIKALVGEIVAMLPAEAKTWQPHAETAALLCKADLTTAMVGEFPELQGIMARLYAEADGQDASISRALEEHYWPITLTGKLPTSDVAAAVALADKMDTLTGDFAIGLIPSGSADPYGLRRAAVGILRILEERKWPISMQTFIQKALEKYPLAVIAARPATASELEQFMKQRFSALLEEREFRFDEIEAVFAGGIGVVTDAVSRLEALHQIRKLKEFEPLAAAFKRAMNIVRQAEKTAPQLMHADVAVRADLLKETCEQALHQVLEKAGLEVSRHRQSGAYRELLESMVPLREPLDGFFNGVMVMAEDPELRQNRLALMIRLVKMFGTIADFSKLQNA
jgi:glycyl-tRNA synthetase beta chain